MIIKKTKIKSLVQIEPNIYQDKRGYFFESYQSKKYQKISKNINFLQDDHSFSKKNVLRGIHFQFKNPQAQLFYLVTGKIFLVAVDFRPNSKTFLHHEKFILDSRFHHQIYTPPGVGSGFYSFGKNNHLIYKISELYKNNKNEIGVMWNDKELNINWPCKKPIISTKDNNNKLITDINFYKFEDLKNL